jgi:hypothetical protein
MHLDGSLDPVLARLVARLNSDGGEGAAGKQVAADDS